MHYKHIFFDLDRTLWDFESNSNEALSELFKEFQLKKKGVESLDAFIKKYKMHNEILWDQYRNGNLNKDVLRSKRFLLTLNDFNIKNFELSKQLGEKYVEICPLKTNVFPFVYDVLDYLSPKYLLYIITNGFEEVQYIKLKKSNMLKYFRHVFTSEQVGVKKPHPNIFKYAISESLAQPAESLMIGDDLLVDILGAKSVGINQVFFNPKKTIHSETITHEISCLSELKKLL